MAHKADSPIEQSGFEENLKLLKEFFTWRGSWGVGNEKRRAGRRKNSMEPLEDDFDLKFELVSVEAGLKRTIRILSKVIDHCDWAEDKVKAATVKAADVKRVLWDAREELYFQIHQVTGALGEIKDGYSPKDYKRKKRLRFYRADGSITVWGYVLVFFITFLPSWLFYIFFFGYVLPLG